MITDYLPLLWALPAKLDGGDVLNYTAEFGLFRATCSGDDSVEAIVQQALGSQVKIGSSRSCTKESLIEAVDACLRYTGEEGCHPNRNFLNSPAFEGVIVAATKELAAFIDTADQRIEIRIDDGHPFYPVLWDFAFAILRGPDAFVLIGSASD